MSFSNLFPWLVWRDEDFADLPPSFQVHLPKGEGGFGSVLIE
jgi:hypothetical protein